jgi:hypothetical protein
MGEERRRGGVKTDKGKTIELNKLTIYINSMDFRQGIQEMKIHFLPNLWRSDGAQSCIFEELSLHKISEEMSEGKIRYFDL